ncbi:MAG: hypothetical protein GZ086_00445 [Gelidibacter sp.]|nr:hypothetical protein [Gelidibacter sp.]
MKDTKNLIPEGHVVARKQILIQEGKTETPEVNSGKLRTKSDKSEVEISNEDMEVTFDKNTGYLFAYTFKGKKFIKKGPEPDFWRAPTDNYFGNSFQKRAKGCKEVTCHPILSDFSMGKNKEFVEVKTSYKLDSVSSAMNMTYHIYADGTIKVDNQFEFGGNTGNLTSLLRFGNSMILPLDYKNVSWYGRGAQENY